MSEYILRYSSDGYIESCDDCSSEVATGSFGDRYYCVFCANTTGRKHDPASKAVVAQMMNILLQEIREASNEGS